MNRNMMFPFKRPMMGKTLSRVVGGLLLLMVLTPIPFGLSSEPVNPLTREFTITIDPTPLKPATWWHVPGVTPLIWTMDPIASEAYRTTDVKQVKLKPGEYRFGTYTFDFRFIVTLDGVLKFSPSLHQCVDGQGTNTLTVRCSHTQPYKQDPEYFE
jgi:hypothetical protein